MAPKSLPVLSFSRCFLGGKSACKFHRGGLPELAGKRVILVDNGLATGSTMEAAVVSSKKRHAKRVLVAVPVASPSAENRIARVSDQVLPLMAVGQYYASFVQTTDEEVLELLDYPDYRNE